MHSLLQRLRLDIVAPAALAVTIFVVAFGSSSPASLRETGQWLRWVALAALLLIAAAYAFLRSDAPRVRLLPLLPLLWLTALAAVSTAWSVQPRLTFERAASFAVVVGIACLFAYATAENTVARRRLVQGLTAGGALVAGAGLLLLAFDSELAAIGNPARFRGLGENPNTVALLAALATPAAAWCALEAGGRAPRALAWTSFTLIVGSLVAAQSRGAVVGAGAGLVFLTLFLARPVRVRAGLTAGAAVLVALAFQLSTYRFDTLSTSTRPVLVTEERSPESGPKVGASEESQGGASEPEERTLLQFSVAREEEFGNPFYTRQETDPGFVSSSGRIEAWKGALDTAMSRPLVGYGFGTEDRIFVDRYYVFKGSRPENAYLGWLLQLGVTGLAAFGLFAASLLAIVVRLVRVAAPTERNIAVGLGAVTVGGIFAALTQSYVYSAGNIATLTFWVAAAALGLSSRCSRG